MSLRAKFLSSVIRRLAKAGGDQPSTETIAQLRQSVEASAAFAPGSPRFVQVLPVDAGGVPAEWVSLRGSPSSDVVVYLHGGTFIAGSPRTHRNLTWRVAKAAQARVIVLDYRLAPEHPFPAAVEDVLAVYTWLLQQGVKRFAFCGDSAGGGLLFSSLRAIHAANLPMPRAALAFSPFVDLAGRGLSWTENAERDPWLTTHGLRRGGALYCGALRPDDPGPSPAYASFEAAPPTLIQVGESEILRDDSFALADRLRAAGAEVEVQVWRDVPHVWHMFAPLLPECTSALRKAGAFLRRHLDG